MKLTLRLLELDLSIVQLSNLPPLEEIPGKDGFFSLTRTSDEVSFVVETKYVEKHWKAEHGWSAIKIDGVLDFELVGVLAGVLEKLAKANVSVFAVSTFNTDYILVKKLKKARVAGALEKDYELIL